MLQSSFSKHQAADQIIWLVQLT